MKQQDSAAANIEFGIELETFIPQTACVQVGPRHGTLAVMRGKNAITGEMIAAPSFNGRYWLAERDGSIHPDAEGFIGCEFVSPILKGEEGLLALRQMVAFINAIGGRVNRTCGCHITVGVASVIGTREEAATSAYAKALTNTAFKHAKAIYAQTGTDRHLNTYAAPLPATSPKSIKKMMRSSDVDAKTSASIELGRGMVNFQKLWTHNCVEFRAFAGTLNEGKILHHLATVFAIMRRASQLQNCGGFTKTKKEQNGQKTAPDAVRYFWKFAGWVAGSSRPCALGLFGILHSEFATYSQVALDMAQKFESRFPNVNL